MLTDPEATAELATREVRSGTRDGAATKIAVVRRSYPVAQEELWQALTDPERIPRWFLPISGELRPGGRYQFQGNAGGVIERCDAPSSLAATWEYGPGVSWIELRLIPESGGTTLELVHEAHVPEEMWPVYGPGAVGIGWDLALAVGLGLHLESGEAVDPELGASFPLTPEGLAFVRRAAAGWAEAAVADGDEPGAAHEAAERTVAFYTTLPEGASEG